MHVDLEYEIEQYKILHTNRKGYGQGGKKYAETISEFVSFYKCKSVLDFGCGKGNLVFRLSKMGIKTFGYDPAVPRFSKLPPFQYDMVVSTDVLEHIPEHCLPEVYEQILSFGPKAIFLVIAPGVAATILPDGTNAHKTIQKPDWWYESLIEAFPNYRVKLEQRCPVAEFFLFRKEIA